MDLRTLDLPVPESPIQTSFAMKSHGGLDMKAGSHSVLFPLREGGGGLAGGRVLAVIKPSTQQGRGAPRTLEENQQAITPSEGQIMVKIVG